MADTVSVDNENICIAVQGCCHGELEAIYQTISHIQNVKGKKIDLLICCGDFQAVRDQCDLESMAVPPKYRQMGVFSEYYHGTKVAPVLTLFVGGNHEASKHLWELPFGGWVAPNIYYLGYAGVVQFGGLRIGGISGIYKDHDYYKGHFEMPPFNESTKRSIYHTRSYEVFKLQTLKGHVDIFVSHDWPRNIYNHGDVEELLAKKSFFRQEIEESTLGSPACHELLKTLKPSYWFSAHLHVKFAALFEHKRNEDNDKKIYTKFLALDKCLPNRDFLQIIDFGPAKSKKTLCYDAEWLAVTKSTYSLYNPTSRVTWVPKDNEERAKYVVAKHEVDGILELFGNDLSIPLNFQAVKGQQSKSGYMNNQTEELCDKLSIKNPCKVSIIRKTEKYNKTDSLKETSSDFDSSSSDDFNEIPKVAGDPSEISLGDSSDDESESSTSDQSKSSELDSPADSKADMKRRHSTDEVPDAHQKMERPFFVRRNKALYASVDDDNSGSSSSDYL